MLCCQTFVITFHSINWLVSSVIKIMYMKFQPLCSVKNPNSLIFSFHYSKQVPIFWFKIYICSLLKNRDQQWNMTVNWMARIPFPTGAGILFIILSRPDLGPPTLVPNGLLTTHPPLVAGWRINAVWPTVLLNVFMTWFISTEVTLIYPVRTAFETTVRIEQ